MAGRGGPVPGIASDVEARMKITESELLEELRRGQATNAPPDAMTLREIAAALGLSLSATKERLRRLRDEGRLAVWTTRVCDSAGRMQMAPAYTILPRKRKS